MSDNLLYYLEEEEIVQAIQDIDQVCQNTQFTRFEYTLNPNETVTIAGFFD